MRSSSPRGPMGVPVTAHRCLASRRRAIRATDESWVPTCIASRLNKGNFSGTGRRERAVDHLRLVHDDPPPLDGH